MQKQHKIFGNVQYYSLYKVSIVKKYFSNYTNSPIKIMEYGCGVGKNISYLQNTFKKAAIYGFDISTKSLEIAKKENPNLTAVYEYEINSFNNFFDLIFIAGVYHHIPRNLRSTITCNVNNLLKKTGHVILFEHNPYNLITARMVNTCEFDEDAVLLTMNETKRLFAEYGQFSLTKKGYCLFIPPKLSRLSFIENYLRWLPIGGQYFLIFSKNLVNFH